MSQHVLVWCKSGWMCAELTSLFLPPPHGGQRSWSDSVKKHPRVLQGVLLKDTLAWRMCLLSWEPSFNKTAAWMKLQHIFCVQWSNSSSTDKTIKYSQNRYRKQWNDNLALNNNHNNKVHSNQNKNHKPTITTRYDEPNSMNENDNVSWLQNVRHQWTTAKPVRIKAQICCYW